MLFDISGPVWILSNVFQTPEPFFYIVLNEILQLICSLVFVRCIPQKKKRKLLSLRKINQKEDWGENGYQYINHCYVVNVFSLLSWDKPVKEWIGWNVFTAKSTQRMD